MKKIMILGAGVYQVPLIKKAKEMNLYTIVVSYKGNYPGFKYADKVYYKDTTNIDEIINIAKKENIDGICTTGTDVAVKTIGRINDKLNLCGINFNSANLASNKLKMKKAFIDNNVRTARYKKVFKLNQAKKIFENFGNPVIFKAVDSSGSRGIIKVDNKSKIDYAFKKVMSVTKKNYFIIEEYIEGEEFGAQAFVYNDNLEFILPHGDIIFTEADAAVPIGHYAPYKTRKLIFEDIKKQVFNSIKALNLNNCAINADFILKEDKVYVLEIGARAGATCLPELVSIYYNIDYYEQIINMSLGFRPEFKLDEANPNASILLTSDKTGIIKKIINNNDANNNILDISFDFDVGDKVNKFKVGPDRVGQIIVKNQTLESVMDLLEEVENNIQIIV